MGNLKIYFSRFVTWISTDISLKVSHKDRFLPNGLKFATDTLQSAFSVKIASSVTFDQNKMPLNS